MMFHPEESLRKKLEAWISANSDAFFQDIAALVEIRSVSEPEEEYPFGAGCARVLEKALSMAEDYGFPGKNHEYYCGTCAMPGVGSEKKRLGLFAHLDVVPEGGGWSSAPYCCTERDGYLVGRGVIDNKGPAVAALYAMRFLKESDIRLQNDVSLYFGCSEETGMADIAYYCRTQSPPDFALVPDNDFPVCFGEKGILRFSATREVTGNLLEFTAGQVVNVVPGEACAVISGVPAARFHTDNPAVSAMETEKGLEIHAKGLSKHAAFPEGSINALHLLARELSGAGVLEGSAKEAVAAVARLTEEAYGAPLGVSLSDEVSGRLTCVGSVARLENGLLTLRFDLRYPVTSKGDEIRAAVAGRLLAEGFAMEDVLDDPPAYVPPGEPAVPALCEIAEYVLGRPLEPYTMGGGTYARKLPRALGFGPGVKGERPPFPEGRGQGHQPDECVRKGLLLDGLRAYVYALMALDNIL